MTSKVKKFKKGDQVIVTQGKDKGKKGTIMTVFTKEHKIIVEGVNMYKKHVRPTKKNLQGGIIDITRPIPTSKVMVICPDTEKPTRVGFKFTSGGQKERIARATGSSLDIKK